ncbi:hypothetical protein [Chryseobacterium arthrosphaerae]|nr:hypothetical protein [Chryseobacterium arthrosphaerae]
MMNAVNMKHDISYHLEANRFILYLEITNHSGGERRFYFSNDTGRLARNGIRLFNTKNEEIQAYEKAFISPAYTTEPVPENRLLPDERQRFKLPAKVFEEENELILSFKGISFRVPRNEKFYITFDFLGIPSNRLEVFIEMVNDRDILEKEDWEYYIFDHEGTIQLSVPVIWSNLGFDVLYTLSESEKEDYLRRGIEALEGRIEDMRKNALHYEMNSWK